VRRVKNGESRMDKSQEVGVQKNEAYHAVNSQLYGASLSDSHRPREATRPSYGRKNDLMHRRSRKVTDQNQQTEQREHFGRVNQEGFSTARPKVGGGETAKRGKKLILDAEQGT